MNNSTAAQVALSYYASINPYLASLSISLNNYITFIILIPGVGLNLFTAGVFCRDQFWNKTTIGYYYCVYSIGCSLYLIGALLSFVPPFFGVNLLVGDVGCKVISFFRFLAGYGYAWTETQMTVDRAILTHYPRKYQWITRPRNLALITCGLYLGVAVCASLNLFKGTSYSSAGLATWCQFSNSLQTAFSVVNISNRIATFTITFTANLFIIQKLFDSKRALNKRNSGGLSKKDLTFAASLMSINIMNFILVLPSFIGQLMQLYATFTAGVSRDFAIFAHNYFNICLVGNYTFAALPFWINLAFNRLFRNALRQMICCQRGAESESRVTRTT